MKVCMIAYTFYETDSRVKRYAETLVKRNDSVDMISLRKENQSIKSRLNGVKVYRIQTRKFNEKRSKFHYLGRLLDFFFRSFFFVTFMHLNRKYDVIHVHSVPDFEVFATWICKLTGAKVILDIHDIVPEFFISKFKADKNSLIYKLLIFIERISIRFSDHIIIANDIWKNTLISRSVKKEKCTSITNYPDSSIFYYREKKQTPKKFSLIYPGTINYHQGIDIAIEAMRIIKKDFPEICFDIYGEGPTKDYILKLIEKYGLQERIKIKGFVPVEQLPPIVANADLGIIPKRKDSFGDEAFSSKSLEFMALGVPVIISDTKIDKYYFNDTIVKYFKSEDAQDLADSIVLLYKNKELRAQLAKNSLEFAQKNSWDIKKTLYLNIVDKYAKRRK